MATSMKRRRQVADLLHQEISHNLQFEIRDPRIGFVTVTGVEVNADLTMATVYVSMMSDNPAEQKEGLAGLESATPYLKRLLGPKVKLRFMPELVFELDHSLAHSQRIHSLLDQIEIPPPEEDELESDEPGDLPSERMS